MDNAYNRRKFLKSASAAGLGFGLIGATSAMGLPGEKVVITPDPVKGSQSLAANSHAAMGKRIGLIGLDTSHSTAFTEALNSATPDAAYNGYKIVAAYPWGSRDIQSSSERIPAYTDEVKKLGVEIVDSIPDLLKKVDVVLLETNDGRPHTEQALLVMKAGKPLFIDKPVAGSLVETIAIFEAARKYKVQVFSASSLRYMAGMQDLAQGKTVGPILGADAFSPSPLEPHHPDFFWYGIHGVETLCTLMGKGCKEVIRINTEGTDIVVGTWVDGRLGTFRGTRTGKNEYGATAFGEKGVARVGPYSGYEALLKEIVRFFDTGVSPVTEEETLEIYAFMEAADESKRKGGVPVSLAATLEKARATRKKLA